jgi:quercetin dioxygenase-like cupin family protein
MDIDSRTNLSPTRSPIEVTDVTAFNELRAYWSKLPMTPKVLANRESAPYVAFDGQETRILLTGEESAGTVNIFDSIARTGFIGGEHYQPNEEEYWFILDGALEVTVGKEKKVIEGGAFAFMPRNCTHAFSLLKDTHIITVNAPAGHDRAFEALQSLSKRSDLAPDAPIKAVGNHEMIIYLDNSGRHPIDQTVNAKPAASKSSNADEAEARRAWAAMPMIPKLVARREDARDVSTPGLDARLLLGPDESAGRYTMLDIIVAPGFERLADRRSNEDQWWYVLDGQLDITVGNVTTSIGKGGFVFAPRGATNALANRSGKPVHMISVHSPGRYELRPPLQ